MKYLTAILFMILVSCSSEWHVKKAVFKSNPEKVFAILNKEYGNFINRKDTIIYDTLVTHISSIDTMKVMGKVDTLVINRNNEIIKIIRHYDTIFVKRNDVSDTSVVKRNLKVYNMIYKDSGLKGNYFNIIVLILLLILILLTIIKRK